MEKFKELVRLCAASVEISVNDHRDIYKTVSDYLIEDDASEIQASVLEEMVKRDTIVKIQAYPHTPIGFYVVYHYDIDKAMDIMLNAVKGK